MADKICDVTILPDISTYIKLLQEIHIEQLIQSVDDLKSQIRHAQIYKIYV